MEQQFVTNTGVIFCRQCGAPMAAGAAFCSACGQSAVASPAVPAMAQNPQPKKSKKKWWIATIAVVAVVSIVLVLLLTLGDGGTYEISNPYASLMSASVGDCVTFGTYEQDNDIYNGAESIEWLVLERREKEMLLISKYGLDCGKYDGRTSNLNWETCEMRTWLNENFYETAFTVQDQYQIVGLPENANGKTIYDWVFLLSEEDVEQYFSSVGDRMCQPTAYAVANGSAKYNYGNCCWWLKDHIGYGCVAAVGSDGEFDPDGVIANGKHITIRPAIWVKTEYNTSTPVY